MTIVITGVGGFIGSALARQYLSDGTRVIGIDNLNDYYSIKYKKHRLNSQLSGFKNFEFAELDMRDQAQVRSIFQRERPSAVIHLAAQAGVRLPLDATHRYVESNLQGFTCVLEETIACRIPNFLFASSSSVYGNTKVIPFNEEDKAIEPISFYGATKLSNEYLARALSRLTETTTLGMRFFSVYGPWGRPDMAYFRILSSIFNEDEFTMFGDGLNLRDLTHINDVVESIKRLNVFVSTNRTSDVVNVGGGKPYSLLELIREIELQSRLKLRIKREITSAQDVVRTVADFSKLSKMTSFVPNVSLQAGVSSLIDWVTSPEIMPNMRIWAK
jgi:UDP-glucuronate 4-epimerase